MGGSKGREEGRRKEEGQDRCGNEGRGRREGMKGGRRRRKGEKEEGGEGNK